MSARASRTLDRIDAEAQGLVRMDLARISQVREAAEEISEDLHLGDDVAASCERLARAALRQRLTSNVPLLLAACLVVSSRNVAKTQIVERVRARLQDSASLSVQTLNQMLRSMDALLRSMDATISHTTPTTAEDLADLLRRLKLPADDVEEALAALRKRLHDTLDCRSTTTHAREIAHTFLRRRNMLYEETRQEIEAVFGSAS